MIRLLLLALALAGCKSSAEQTCQRAAERYEQCIGEVLGPGARAMVHGKIGAGVSACARSDQTVAMYRECLDKPTCRDFDQCMDDFAERTAPRVDPKLSRSAQCEQHVKNAERSSAFAIVTASAISDDDKRRAVDCLASDDVVASTCLGATGRAELARRSSELARECAAWSDEVAACKLELPGAHACDDDEPASDVPKLDLGPTGPPIAWSTSIAKADTSLTQPIVWAADHVLVYGDGNQLRAERDGKELWQAAGGSDVASSSSRIVVGSEHGLRVLETATGSEIAAPLDDIVFALSADDRRALVMGGGDILYELDVQHCTRARCPMHRLAELAAEGLIAAQPRATADGTLLITTLPDVAVLLDRRYRPRVRIVLDDGRANHLAATPDGLAVGDDDGVALLAPSACAALASRVYVSATGSVPASCDGCKLASGRCVATRIAVADGAEALTALPGHGVAFNDAAPQARTHVVLAERAWATRTGGEGVVAADQDNVYTIAQSGPGKPVRVVALARDSGQPRWHTDLPGTTSAVAARVVVQDGYLAAGNDDHVFVIRLPAVNRGP